MQKTPLRKPKLCALVVFYSVCLILIAEYGFSQSITWERIYNGPGNNSDGFRSICQADGNNMFVAGYTFLSGSGSSERIFVLKISPYGDTLWARIIGDNLRPECLAIVSSGDGGCVLTGSWNEAFTIKFNSQGGIIWQKFYGGSGIQLFDIKQTLDGGYVACGRDDNANFDGFIIKIDSTGDLVWQKTYPAQFYRVFSSIELTADNAYILVGSISNFPQDIGKGFVTKVNSIGDTLWQRTFSVDTLTSAEKISKISNGYLIGGNVRHRYNIDYSRMYLYKIDFNGNGIFAKIFNSTVEENLYDIEVFNNNKYLMTGYLDSSSILFGKVRIVDSALNPIRERTLNTPGYIVPYSILHQNNGDLIIAGEADMNINPYNDAYAIRLDSNLNYVPIGINNISNILPNKMMLYPNYPNPFNPETIIRFDLPTSENISITVYNILGSTVYSIKEYREAGSYELKFDGTNLASGMYFYSFEAGKYRDVKKMVLLK